MASLSGCSQTVQLRGMGRSPARFPSAEPGTVVAVPISVYPTLPLVVPPEAVVKLPAGRPHPLGRAPGYGTEDLLRSLGHHVERHDPAYNEIGAVFMPRYLRGIADDAADLARPELLQRRTRGFARLGRALPDSVVERAIRDEARQAARINRVFERYDVLMTPTTARPPVGAAEWEGLGAVRTLLGMVRVYPYTATWNATGQPAASVPAGFSSEGLPLAVQLVGRAHDEATLLSLAAQVEAERPWAGARPPVS